MSTNKEVLLKGIKILLGTIFLIVLSTFVINSATKNQDHSLFIPVLGVGLILFIGAIYFGFKGIRTLMRALFGD